VRVIGPDGAQIGIVDIQEALRLSDQANLDLVEISPSAKPPVCKIIDFGKYKYELQKKVREGKKKQHVIQMKEIRLRPNIEPHDFDFKMRNMRKFLEQGHKVKATIMFQGREVIHQNLGEKVLSDLQLKLEDIGKLEAHPKKEGRNIVAIFIKK
jgi:translation initiation factor IF-3